MSPTKNLQKRGPVRSLRGAPGLHQLLCAQTSPEFSSPGGRIPLGQEKPSFWRCHLCHPRAVAEMPVLRPLSAAAPGLQGGRWRERGPAAPCLNPRPRRNQTLTLHAWGRQSGPHVSWGRPRRAPRRHSPASRAGLAGVWPRRAACGTHGPGTPSPWCPRPTAPLRGLPPPHLCPPPFRTGCSAALSAPLGRRPGSLVTALPLCGACWPVPRPVLL